MAKHFRLFCKTVFRQSMQSLQILAFRLIWCKGIREIYNLNLKEAECAQKVNEDAKLGIGSKISKQD